MSDENALNCYVCSKTNPIGLHLKPIGENGKAFIEFEVKKDYEGYNGVMHGGFAAMLLDEVMFHSLKSLGLMTVTLNINTDFVSPALVGHRLLVEAWVAKRDGRKVYMEGKITDGETIVARGTGLYLTVDVDKFLKTSKKK